MISFFKKKSKRRYFLVHYSFFGADGSLNGGEGNISISVADGFVNHKTIRFIRKEVAEILRKENRVGKHKKIQIIIRNLIEKNDE